MILFYISDIMTLNTLLKKGFKKSKKYYLCGGEMAEWSIAAVLKTVVPHRGTGGSNPSFSADLITPSATPEDFHFQNFPNAV
jgi:hypothetical protein